MVEYEVRRAKPEDCMDISDLIGHGWICIYVVPREYKDGIYIVNVFEREKEPA